MSLILNILQHTPIWVWALLVGLIALGSSQTRSRAMTLRRVTVLPLVLALLSLVGVISAFGLAPAALGGWAAGMGAMLLLGRSLVRVRAAQWDAAQRRLHVPGSWLPMVLIVGLFLIKYVAGVTLAMHPDLAANGTVAGLFSLAYGSFSGLFLARAASLRLLARPSQGLRAA